MSGEPAVSPPPRVASKPRQKAPAGAADCHFHVFGPTDRYPLNAARGHTPSPEANIENYQIMADTLGIERMVIVNATPYGTDARCTADSIEIFGKHRARGVAVVNDSVSDATLRDLDQKGFCAARISSVLPNSTPVSEIEHLARRIEPLGWHLDIYIKGEELPSLEARLLSLPVPVAIDHMGMVPTSRGVHSPEFQTLLRLAASGKCWVKMTGYRCSVDGPPYADLMAAAQKLIAAAPERCIWGSDWPHPRREGPLLPDDGKMLDLLSDWAPDPKDFRRILVDNPVKLYGFAS